jgi:nucleoside-diphosphate-sugar epimerase
MASVFITGATGFVGTRLVEMTIERGHTPVCFVRNWSRAVRLARMPVRMVEGDMLDPKTLTKAMDGCDVVFHCAVDNRIGGRAHRRSSARGTQHVMQAALDAKVARVVHVSSTAVYGYSPDASTVTEGDVHRLTGDAYCDGKIAAERVAMHYHRAKGLPVAIVRPTLVYGPFAPLVTAIADAVRNGRMIHVDGGRGVCNSLYIDNLVDAMWRAAECDAAVGEVFHVSDAQPIGWHEFVERHAQALVPGALPLGESTRDEIVRARRASKVASPSSIGRIAALARDPDMRRALRSIPAVERVARAGLDMARTVLSQSTRQRLRRRLSGPAPSSARKTSEPGASQILEDFEIDMFSTFQGVTFSIDKARRLLGYHPRISVAEGLTRTAAWMQWARL